MLQIISQLKSLGRRIKYSGKLFSIPIEDCRTIFGMRFLGVHHLVYGLNHEQQRYRFLEYYLQSDFRDQIKSITNRHADVGVFDFPWELWHL